MKVLVVGANGQIGQQIVSMLGESEKHDVIAMVRKQEQVADMEKRGAQALVMDLEGDVTGSTDGCDAVIFTAGSGGHTGADKTILVDLDGAYKMVDESKRTNVDHFIMISAFHADDPSKGSERILHYNVAKQRADERLIESGLNYTVLRPGGLTNEAGTGKIRVGKELPFQSDGERTIPREDVARTAVLSLDIPEARGKAFKMLSGDTPIDEAIRSVEA